MNPVKRNYFDYPKVVKFYLLLYIIGFSIGTSTHTMDLLKGGFLPYTLVPLWKNIFWTSLTLFDFIAVILLLKSIIPALVLSNLIMISDVLVNSIGIKFNELASYTDSYKLIMQIVFCIYILITTPIILKRLNYFTIGREN